MTLWIATARDIGFADYYKGNPRCLNPYEPGTREENMWFEGWDLADERDKQLQDRHD